MPLGVAHEFLHLLQEERRAANRRTWFMAALVIALAPAAHFLMPPWGAFVHVGAAALGTVAGWRVWKRVGGRRARSLRDQWVRWMETADRHQTLAEREARAAGRVPQRRLWWSAFVAGVSVVELALLVLAFTPPESIWMRAPAAAFPGLVAGFGLGVAIDEGGWCTELQATLDAMIRDGELGAWGAH